MKRLTAMLVCAFAALPAAAQAATTQAPRAHLRGLICQRALDPGARAMSITAVMRPLAGTVKMQMRFQLLQRSRRGAAPTAVAGRKLNRWFTPTSPATIGQLPGDVWIVHHPVTDLAAPDLYRFRVGFRWTGAGGAVLGEVTKSSRSCVQPEMRPDLRIPAVTIVPLTTNAARYAAIVGNHGNTAAGPFTVQLTVGTQVLSLPVAGLAPHTRTTVRFTGPVCTAGEQITAVADPGPNYQVDDANRANNTWAEMCPGATSGPTASNPPASGIPVTGGTRKAR